jgi:uncharacterized protein with GYD domain
MPTYVRLVNWTEQGARAVREAVTRGEQGRQLVERAGARVIGWWWTQGRYDMVIVLEAPDDETASALALSMGMAGNVRTETLRAYDREEMRRILDRLPG